MTLVRDDAEAAWEIPDSPSKREHALSSVKENDSIDEPDSKDTVQESIAKAEVQKVTNTEVNVGVEIAPPPVNIVRERPRKAHLVKTLDFADDLSENAFGTVTESDLDKRTDSDISSGNDSTETHTISLSFRETFDGRHRNTVSAVSSCDSGRNERGEHRAYSFPHQASANTNSANADKEDIRLRSYLSKSAGSVISPIDRGTESQDKQNFQSFVKSKTENIGDLTSGENDKFDTNTEIKMQPADFVDSIDNTNEEKEASVLIGKLPALNDASDNLSGMPENNNLETEIKIVQQNTDKTFDINFDSLNPVSEETNDESFIVLQSTDDHLSFSITPDEAHISADTSQELENTTLSNPIDDSSHLLKNDSVINDDLTYTDTVPSPRTDIPFTAQNLQTEITENSFPGSHNAALFQEGGVDRTSAHFTPESKDSKATSMTPEDFTANVAEENMTIESGSMSQFSVTTENDSLNSINIIEPLNNENSESQNQFLQLPSSDEIKSNMLHANPLPEEAINDEVKSSLTVDSMASLTLSKDNLFFDAPPTPMIVVPDSYIHEPETGNPVLFDIKDKESGSHGSDIQEMPESQSSTRSNSFDFDFVADFRHPETCSIGNILPAEAKLAVLNEVQTGIQKNTVIIETELQSASADMLETSTCSDKDSQGQNVPQLTNTNKGTLESFDKNDLSAFDSGDKQASENHYLIFREEVDKKPLTMENSDLGTNTPGLSTEENTSLKAQSENVTNIVAADDNLIDTSASNISEPFHSTSVFESANFNSFLSNDTWDKRTSFNPLEIDVDTPEIHTQIKNTDIFDGGNTDLFTSSMAASTDSSGPSWELISEASPNSKDSNPFHLETSETVQIMYDSHQCENDRNDKPFDLLCQEQNLPEFAGDGSADRIEERKISDSSSSREGDMSWDLINESSDATDNGNHPNADDDNGSSFA